MPTFTAVVGNRHSAGMCFLLKAEVSLREKGFKEKKSADSTFRLLRKRALAQYLIPRNLGGSPGA